MPWCVKQSRRKRASRTAWRWYRKCLYWPTRRILWRLEDKSRDYGLPTLAILTYVLGWVFAPVTVLVIVVTNWYTHHIRHLEESYFERKGKKWVESLKGGTN